MDTATKEQCIEDGQDPTQNNRMPMMAIEQSEQSQKPRTKGINHASTTSNK